MPNVLRWLRAVVRAARRRCRLRPLRPDSRASVRLLADLKNAGAAAQLRRAAIRALTQRQGRTSSRIPSIPTLVGRTAPHRAATSLRARRVVPVPAPIACTNPGARVRRCSVPHWNAAHRAPRAARSPGMLRAAALRASRNGSLPARHQSRDREQHRELRQRSRADREREVRRCRHRRAGENADCSRNLRAGSVAVRGASADDVPPVHAERRQTHFVHRRAAPARSAGSRDRRSRVPDARSQARAGRDGRAAPDCGRHLHPGQALRRARRRHAGMIVRVMARPRRNRGRIVRPRFLPAWTCRAGSHGSLAPGRHGFAPRALQLRPRSAPHFARQRLACEAGPRLSALGIVRLPPRRARCM
jgi:hypothetical protein